jgi:hypothetical protein
VFLLQKITQGWDPRAWLTARRGHLVLLCASDGGGAGGGVCGRTGVGSSRITTVETPTSDREWERALNAPAAHD